MTCERCGADFIKGRSTQRFCSAKCRTSTRPRRNRAKSVEIRADLTCVEAVTAVLTESGRLAHPSGVAALTIARRIDAGPESSAGHAALVKQMQTSLEVALDRAEVEADPVDELRQRREQRRA